MRSSLPRLIRQSIRLLKKLLAKKMDARVKPAHRLGQALEVARRPRSNLIERGRRPNTLAALHDQLDQRIAGLLVMLDGEDVASHAAVGTHAPPHLLAARPGGFAGGALAPRQAG